MQRCHVKPTDCNGMYKIPVKKLEAIVKAKEIKAKAKALAKHIAKKKASQRKACAGKVPYKMIKKILAARKQGKCIKIHMKYCKDNIAKLPLKTLKKIVVHKKAVHIMKKIKAKVAAKKQADTVKAARCMSSKELKKAAKCSDPKKCKSNVGKLPKKILKQLIKVRKAAEHKKHVIKRAKRKAVRIIRRKKRAIKRKIRVASEAKAKVKQMKKEIHIKAKAAV